MYSDVFCKVYNTFGWNYYPEFFAEELLLWLKEQQLTPKTSMDLACGTGILCKILRETGVEAAGMDFSSGMIQIARENCPGIPFDVADMITYRPDKRFDLVTCTGDALNHIEKLSDVEKIFENVRNYLSEGGHFIFDVLNAHEISTSEPFEMDYDEHTRVWFQMTQPEEGKVNLKIRVFEDGKEQFEENIRETVHDVAAICDLLRKTGFTVVRCADSLREGAGHGTTWFVIARKD